MKTKKHANLAASVHQRLLNASREAGDDPNHTFGRFAMERLLYRLSSSRHAKYFILKGAMLFMAWTGKAYRPTFDLDLLGFGEDSAERIAGAFKELCSLEVEPDGLVFDAASVRLEPIREDQEYHGQRVTLTALLGKARIPVQVDIAFGDAVTPKAEEIKFPTILDFPAPHMRACPRETVVAEKLHAMTILGIANSRMKDFHDVYVLARDFPFEGATLVRAIAATFERRKTTLPNETPLALTDEFARDAMKITQWKAFIRKGGIGKELPELPGVILRLGEFLLPPLTAAARKGSPPKGWKANGPWEV